MHMTEFPNLIAARAGVIAAGYVIKEGVGEAGDYGYGSREYWKHPDSPVNQYGNPLWTATISKMPGGWCTFDLDPYGMSRHVVEAAAGEFPILDSVE